MWKEMESSRKGGLVNVTPDESGDYILQTIFGTLRQHEKIVY